MEESERNTGTEIDTAFRTLEDFFREQMEKESEIGKQYLEFVASM